MEMDRWPTLNVESRKGMSEVVSARSTIRLLLLLAVLGALAAIYGGWSWDGLIF
jgi:hypothetical protein